MARNSQPQRKTNPNNNYKYYNSTAYYSEGSQARVIAVPEPYEEKEYNPRIPAPRHPIPNPNRVPRINTNTQKQRKKKKNQKASTNQVVFMNDIQYRNSASKMIYFMLTTTLVAALFIISLVAAESAMQHRYSSTESQLRDIREEINTRQTMIDDSYQLEDVRVFAMETLDMVKPEKHQTVTIHVPKQSYMTQYSQESKAENSLLNVWTSLFRQPLSKD